MAAKRSTPSTGRLLARSALELVVAAGLLGITTAGLAAYSRQSTDPSASKPALETVALSPTQEAVVLDRQGDLADQLKFPRGRNHSTRHVIDRRAGREFDDVVEADNSGRALSQIRFDNHGKLVSATRFDIDFAPPASSSKPERSHSLQLANDLKRRLGLRATGPTEDVTPDDTGGWAFSWGRFEQGVPVRGDGSQVRLLPDGRPWAVSETFHDLANPPTAVMPSGKAADIVLAMMRDSGMDTASFTVLDAQLMWVCPNNWWAGADDLLTDTTARLAWVVSVRPADGSQDQLRLAVVYIDAGSGSLLGGDSIS